MDRTFDRTLLARHIAICAAGATAYFLRSELEIGYTALAIVSLGAVLNFLAYAVQDRRGLARACRIASPIIGVGSWAALIAVTRGVASPFVAGLGLEVVLSAMALRRPETVLVTAGAVAALWAQQLWLGTEGAGSALVLQTGFLCGMGGATFLVTRRWIQTQSEFSQRNTNLGNRLALLERELENERALSQLGERVGRVAHGLKNAVHSLRGFVGLIEPKLQGRRSDQAALAGLRSAIDRLETLARLTLDAKETGETGETTDLHASDCAPARCLERAVREISLSHPGVHWATASDGTNPALPISAADLLEVLLILLRNGAEATNGGGKGSIQMHSAGSEFHVVVCDGGAGFSPEATSRIFEPGYTTKPEGSGYGLFLARRILEKHGGHLEAKRTGGGGATFELALPVTPGERASPAIARSR